ncbi:cupin domain-containing protein [Nonomuraea sp. NPDC046570]|uniref:cupin domain-containing protein n=1 Tax=Nonomuraea sp. NPDC046570 TaxID=3155255 RepID=UPI0033FE1F20
MSGFPGAVGLSHLRPYDCGGSPHLHTASTEGYVVVGGEGTLETLSAQGYGEHPLTPGTVLWFTPGTVHRVRGELEILVVMENAGLPEAGDAVMTFPTRVLASAEEYAKAAAPPADEAAAARRRDLAVEGYESWRDRVTAEGPGALAELHELAVALVAPRLGRWRELWRDRALAQAELTGTRLDHLGKASTALLAEAAVSSASPTDRLGMCGHLRAYHS